MRTKKVNQYTCDHCGKRGYSASHMAKHERRCTMNPMRECGMCEMVGESPRLVSDLVKMLPDPLGLVVLGGADDLSHVGQAVEVVMPALREATRNCPACILAALRQSGIPVPLIDSFDFKSESQAWLKVANEREALASRY